MREATREEVRRVLYHPDIAPLIYDEAIPNDLEIPDTCHCITETGDDIFILDWDGDFHPMLLKTVRKRAVELGKKACDYFFDICGYELITALTPKENRYATRYAKKLGFTVEIINEFAYCELRSEQ